MEKLSIEERLRERHPNLMRDVTCGCFCGEGWFDLIDSLLTDIESLNQDKSIKVNQIKEKFGGLRIYLNHYGEDMTIASRISDLINIARAASTTTCESCGTWVKTGPTSGYPNKHWIKTYCPDCRTILDLI
jgi:hypothetical protein